MKRLALVIAVFGALGLAGCATKNADGGAQASRPVKVREDGRLTVAPAPLTLRDVQRQPAGSPQRTVMALWFWAQWGSGPEVVMAYDQDVRTFVGVSRIMGAYGQQRQTMVSSRPKVEVSLRRGPSKAFVGLTAQTASTPPARYSYTLRRREGKWFITYDTLLEIGLAAYVQTLAAANPDARKAEPRAVKAGTAAARRYRDLLGDSYERSRDNPSP